MGISGTAQELPDSPTVSGNLNQRSYTRKFLVKTDNKSTGPLSVVSAPGIPLLYSPYGFGTESDPYALLRDIDAERISDGALQWVVTCKYSTPEPNSGNPAGGSKDPSAPTGTKQEQAGQQDNPQIQLPEIEVTFERHQQVVYAVYDISDSSLKPCKASNGQVFDPPPQRDVSRMIVTISRNEPITAPHPALGIQYMDAVSSDVFFGCVAGTWKMQSIVAQRQTKQLNIGGIPTTLPYLKCTYKMEARPTWDALILDAGAFYIESSTGKKKAFITDDGHPRIGALNGTGDKLPDGDPPVFRTFRFYQRLPFAALNLPQAFIDFA